MASKRLGCRPIFLHQLRTIAPLVSSTSSTTKSSKPKHTHLAPQTTSSTHRSSTSPPKKLPRTAKPSNGTTPPFTTDPSTTLPFETVQTSMNSRTLRSISSQHELNTFTTEPTQPVQAVEGEDINTNGYVRGLGARPKPKKAILAQQNRAEVEHAAIRIDEAEQRANLAEKRSMELTKELAAMKASASEANMRCVQQDNDIDTLKTVTSRMENALEMIMHKFSSSTN